MQNSPQVKSGARNDKIIRIGLLFILFPKFRLSRCAIDWQRALYIELYRVAISICMWIHAALVLCMFSVVSAVDKALVGAINLYNTLT